jgi:hypothetical protein
MPNVNQLLNRLGGDTWRNSHPFSPDINMACEVLLNPYAREDERKTAIRAWLTKFQPCVFGQVAAQGDRLFMSVIDENLLKRGDKAIREKLRYDKRAWKQWSIGGRGKHGFLLAVLSPALHFARPDLALKNFGEHVRGLFTEESKSDPIGNDMTYEWLYLKNPKTNQIHKFRVILDFFASAGDGRWWHDHRFPGGIAFTFNSLGHMVRTREWYEKNTNPTEWAARMAMHTISNAHPHEVHGQATWLLDLVENSPMKSASCPFSDPQKLSEKIKGKDWTTYEGYHHTDHSVRAEFFDGREIPDRSRGPYFMDFSYIAGGSVGENMELMDGLAVDVKTVYEDIGDPSEWRFAKPMAKAGREKTLLRPRKEALRIAAALRICGKWLHRRIRI